MGATNIHYRIAKNDLTPKEAFNQLVEYAREDYGNDPYNGTISTCRLVGQFPSSIHEEDEDSYLDLVGKREVRYYEKDGHYHFIGWAAC